MDIITEHTQTSWTWPLLMAFIRLPLALAGSGIVILAYRLAGRPAGIAAGLGWSTLTLTLVNLICLSLLAWRARVEGFDLFALIGFSWRRVPGDLGWGLVWSLLLDGLLLAGIFAVGFVFYGSTLLDSFEEMFVGRADFSFFCLSSSLYDP